LPDAPGVGTEKSHELGDDALHRDCEVDPLDILVVLELGADHATGEELRREVEDVVCFATPEPFMAVGRFYDDFAQTTDDEVRDLLAAARAGHESARPA
jgi:predicted phosphoribosyltransferase